MTHRSVHPGPGRAWPGAEILAAGAVLYRHTAETANGGNGIEVALIHRPRHGDWTFPKGKLEPGEHVLAAAVREVTEETGIRPVLGRPLATVRYSVDGRPKRVDYWAALVDHPPPGPFVPNNEVDNLEWVPSGEAATRLTYAHDQRLLDLLLPSPGEPATLAAPGGQAGRGEQAGPGGQAGRGEEAGPGGQAGRGEQAEKDDEFGPVGPTGRDTVPFILLRHASAGHKGTWPGDDLLRPLDRQGLAEAQTLTDLLACYAPQRVISSPAERCLGTIRPYAEQIGAPIEADPAFSVLPADVPPADVQPADVPPSDVQPSDDDSEDLRAAAQRRISELIAHPSPMVICAHGENLPLLLDQARALLSTPAQPAPSPDDPAWSGVEPHDSYSDAAWVPPKGGFWVLHIANGQLCALEHHDLTT